MKKLLLISLLMSTTALAGTRWTADAANQWQARQGWIVGANYTPASAINQLEFWQKETFDPIQIDHELGLAEQIGLTGIRVFLHDLVWQADQTGFVERINTFLTIADHHHIKPLFVLFDSCWNPSPKLGPQPAPIPGVHNSGWVQSPGSAALLDPTQVPRLKAYITGIVGTFSKDPRILGWDVWNEPDNIGGSSDAETAALQHAVETLIPQVFDWARSANPTQPLTSGVWDGDWSADDDLNPTEKVQLGQSDVISFHSYAPPQEFEAKIKSLTHLGRPIFCTEYMARTLGSTFQTNLPIAKQYGVNAFNWGFVAGKTQTYYPWESWEHPYPAGFPAVWFHDVLFPDGHPYDPAETQLIHSLVTSSPLR